MNWKLVAGLACGTALLLGACSGGNNAGTSSGTTPPTGDNGGSNGNGDDGNGGGGGTDSTELTAAKAAFASARRAVGLATEAADTARRTNTEADRDAARRLIGLARTALDEAGDAADAAVDAVPEGAENNAALGEAIKYRDRTVTPYISRERTALNDAERPFLWFTRALARQTVADPDFRVPRGTTTNDDGVVVSRATIVRKPRTKANAAGTAQIANTDPPANIKNDGTTFKLVPYASDKVLFSSDARHSGAETFKVEGYINSLNTGEATPGAAAAGHTGLGLTNSGLVIRYGGLHADWTDTRMKLNTEVDDAGTDAGANGWDLTIMFGNPQTLSAARGNVRSWQGNGDFYWKARVDAHSSQLMGGDNYVEGLLTQPAGYKNLGTYEVWLSNHIGVNKGLEPVEGAGVVTCRDRSLSSANGNACPDDDLQLYLNYAAYGMFLYKADDGLNFVDINTPGGRVQSINFGYSAFENKANRRTTNIGEPITSGKFKGRTIAVAYRGNARRINNVAPKVLSKLVRGDVELTVTIPKSTGSGTVYGHIDGFEEWDAANNRWKSNAGNAKGITLISSQATGTRPLGTITRVDLYSSAPSATTTTGAPIDANTGEFAGKAKVPANGGTNVLNVLNDHAATGVNSLGGVFRGNFYGPLATQNDLEVAGTWRLGQVAENEEDKWSISGSFGAKQAAAPASSN